jgi:hypothetical protein
VTEALAAALVASLRRRQADDKDREAGDVDAAEVAR